MPKIVQRQLQHMRCRQTPLPAATGLRPRAAAEAPFSAVLRQSSSFAGSAWEQARIRMLRLGGNRGGHAHQPGCTAARESRAARIEIACLNYFRSCLCREHRSYIAHCDSKAAELQCQSLRPRSGVAPGKRTHRYSLTGCCVLLNLNGEVQTSGLPSQAACAAIRKISKIRCSSRYPSQAAAAVHSP